MTLPKVNMLEGLCVREANECCSSEQRSAHASAYCVHQMCSHPFVRLAIRVVLVM